MTKLMCRFMLCRRGVTAIEYALLGSGVALAIVTALGVVGTQLSSSFTHIADAFPQLRPTWVGGLRAHCRP